MDTKNELMTLIQTGIELYGLETCTLKMVPPHEGGRNQVAICTKPNGNKYVMRISVLDDRDENDYKAETEFVHYLACNGAAVADVIPSVNGRNVESIKTNEKRAYIVLFEYAHGMLISDNGYRYRAGAPLSEYFYNTGKTLGQIHRLSKTYTAKHNRQEYADKYNMEYINALIPDKYPQLKDAIASRFARFQLLPKTAESYGLVHFDFSDGNYHIDMNTGKITVYDFDNCMRCWYMFDLANLWTHGVGWYQYETDQQKRKAGMEDYFSYIISGYREETELSDEMLKELPLFIDMVLIENIVDDFECAKRIGEEPDPDDIEDAAYCLINNIQYAGFFE